MTPEALAAIEARAAAATPGPWEDTAWDDEMFMSVCGVRAESGQVIVFDCNCHVASASALREGDQEFIAAARRDVPALVAEVRRLGADSTRDGEALRIALQQRDSARALIGEGEQ